MCLYSPCLSAHSLCTLLRSLCAQLFDEKLDKLTVQHVYVCARIAEFVSQCFLRTTIHIQTNIHQVQFQWCVGNRLVVDLQCIQKSVVCTTRKSPIYKCLVQVVVTNVFQILLECKGEIYTNIFPAIVSEEMFDRANILKQGNKLGKNSLTTDFMLRGKLFCGYCGKTICGESGTSHTGNKRYYYKCLSKKQNTKNCKKKTVRKDDLEKFVTDITMAVLNTPSNKGFVIDKITEVIERKRDSFEALERLKRQREKIKFETDNIVATISQGVTNKAILGKLDELEKQADDLDVQILIEENKRLDVIERGKIEKFLNEYVKKTTKQMLQTLIQKAVLIFAMELIFSLSCATTATRERQQNTSS